MAKSTMMKRVMSLLDRGFIERRNRHGQIIHASNNGALYRRPVLERYRFEAGHGPFVSSHLRQHAMLKDGVAMEVATGRVSIHAYEGLGFIWDVRRNKGYQFARMDLRTKSRSFEARPRLSRRDDVVQGKPPDRAGRGHVSSAAGRTGRCSGR